jgi:Lipase (class 3)
MADRQERPCVPLLGAGACSLMEVVMPVGPSLDELSPFKQKQPRLQFPVLPNLPDDLVLAANHPVGHIAYALATCSGYAYSDANTVAMMMARMGLFENHCAEVALADDAMFIDSKAYLVQSEDGRVVILCYRGTPPMNLIAWLLDADLDPERISVLLSPDGAPDPDHWVHSGFYRNVRATRYKVVEALGRAMRGESVLGDGHGPMPNSLKALYITGHSLGAAMAALMAVILHAEPAYEDIRRLLKAVYTFGQPMVGPPAVAEYCRKAPGFPPLIRYVHRSDVVPRVPPLDSGKFEHFGAEYLYRDEGCGTWQPSTPSIRQVNLAEFAVMAPSDFLTRRLTALRKVSAAWNGVARRFNDLLPVRLACRAARRLPFEDAFTRLPLVYSWEDHSPNHYISKLAPKGVLSEFGDVR